MGLPALINGKWFLPAAENRTAVVTLKNPTPTRIYTGITEVKVELNPGAAPKTYAEAKALPEMGVAIATPRYIEAGESVALSLTVGVPNITGTVNARYYFILAGEFEGSMLVSPDVSIFAKSLELVGVAFG